MSIEGLISIRLDPGSEFPVHLSSSRPRQVMKLLQGLEPQALQHKIPLLYSLCGKAQNLASTQALAGAGAQVLITPEQQRDVVIEALQAYLWRFLIDLPQQLHRQPDLSVLAPMRQALAKMGAVPPDSDEAHYQLQKLDQSLKNDFFGMTPESWLGLTVVELDCWLDQYPVALPIRLRELRRVLALSPAVATAPTLLPDPPQPQWLHTLGALLGEDTEFSFAPHWRGQQPETGALSYQQHRPWLIELQGRGSSPVLMRMIARLFELLRLRACLTQAAELYADALSGSQRLADNTGLGWVRTARGLLLHRVQLQQGVVSEYQILAPTEWNFHPQGPLFSGLQPWLSVASERLPDWVGLQVLSLDPCVQYQFEVRHA